LVHIQIAIDGPAGAGKSTIAKILAERLGFIYIDTGAMYRAVTYLALQQGVLTDDEEELASLAEKCTIELYWNCDGSQQVLLNGQDVSQEIRSPLVSRMVSQVARHPKVRSVLVRKQRQMADEHNVVMDGRDIGTTVLTGAEVKLFVTATLEERARRRFQEMKDKGFTGSLEEIKAELSQRDQLDQNREASPLVAAKDAILIDTTDSSLEEAVEHIYQIILKAKESLR